MQSKLLLKTILITLLTGHFAMAQQNWSPLTSGTTSNLNAVQFLNVDTGYAAGDAGTVVKTTDGGLTWSPVNITTSNPIRSISFVNTMTGWACTGDANNSSNSGQIWMTTNGGTTWTPQTPSTTEARFGISMVSGTNGWACGSRNGPLNIDGSVNGGTSWTNQSNSNIFGWTYGIDAVSTTTAFSVGGAFFPAVSGFIVKTTNSGTTWSQDNTGTIPFLYGVDAIDNNTAFVVGDAGAVLITTNGGTTWTPQTSGTSSVLNGVSFVSATNGWSCGDSGVIVKTVNGGTTWTADNSGTFKTLHGIFALNSTTAWAVGDSGTIITIPGPTAVHIIPETSSAVSIYPNPFSSKATIEVSSAAGKVFSFIVYDMLGNEVKQVSVNNNGKAELTNQSMSRGIYTYVLIKEDNTISGRGKFIISN